jgi:hypothetical protein
MFESVEPYMSARDNEAGVRWSAVISSQLDESDFGILCLTPDNLQAPWLLFEAGALSKSVDVARVVPVLWNLAPADVTTPLSQFHMKEVDESGVRDVVLAINSALERPRPDAALNAAFEALWPSLQRRLNDVSCPSPSSSPRRTERQILEEILEIVRISNQGPTPSSAALVTAARADVRTRREQRLVAELQEQLDKGSYIEVEQGRLTVHVRNPRAYQRVSRLIELYEPDIKDVGLVVELVAPQAVVSFLRESGAWPTRSEDDDSRELSAVDH